MQLLVERVDVRVQGLAVRLRPKGLAGLVREVAESRRGGGVKKATVSADGETITVHIPITFRKRGGRKMVVTPNGAPWAPRPRVDNALVKALTRAFRWQKMLDEGICRTIEELAEREKVNRGYMRRVLRLTLLAPDLVEAILDGRQPEEIRLEGLLCGFPVEWAGQNQELLILPQVLLPTRGYMSRLLGSRSCARHRRSNPRSAVAGGMWSEDLPSG